MPSFPFGMHSESGVLLGGADVFHLVHDRVMAAEKLGANQCALVLELEDRVDEARLARRIAVARAVEPHLDVCLDARRLRQPRWVPSRPGDGRVRVIPTGDEPLRVLERLLSTRATHDERPWEIVIVRGPRRDAVLLVWFHPFTDAKGAARLATFLGADDAPRPLPFEVRHRARPEALDALDRSALLSLSRAYNDHILGFSRRPVLSLRGASPRAELGGMRFRRIVLSPEETRALDRSIRTRAKLAESSALLLASARAVDGALRRRGYCPVQQLVPVPISLDPKGFSDRLFGNHLTMMMFAVGRDDLADEARALASLAEQQRVIVREKLDLAMAAALELVRVLPTRLYLGLATLPFGGELSSFVFSNPGKIELETFLGAPVRDALSVPTPVPRPGIELIASRHAGRFSLLLGFYEGLLSAGEADAMVEDLRAGIFGEPSSGRD